MGRIKLLLGVILLSFSLNLSAGKAVLSDTDFKHGKHKGEVEQLEVEVFFDGNFGSTITDDTGTYYNINWNAYYMHWFEVNFGLENIDPWNGYQVWSTDYENKVYDSKYHVGSRDYEFTSETTVSDVLDDDDAGVPLYFFGTETVATVAITNNGPRKKTKIRVETEAFVLNTDGSNGATFGNKQIRDIEVARGETVLLDASFFADPDTALDSGLDRYRILISHPNNGGGPGNERPALIAAYEAIFCPPEFEENLIEQMGL